MSDNASHYKIISCECDDLIELTSQVNLPKLDNCLLALVTKYTPQCNISLVHSSLESEAAKQAKYITDFELKIDDRTKVKLIVEQKLSEDILQKISNLCSVYANQYKLISRISSDQLTKLGNRQGLNDKFAELFNFSKANQRKKETNYCIAIFDIDHFKKVNDNFGHLYGDEVLLQLSQLMTKTFRDQDYLFRYGGEEFVAILGDVTLNQAKTIMQRFRKIVENHQFPLVGKVTISIGLTALDKKAGSIINIERADKALYFAKGNGRNQLRVYEDLIKSGDLLEVSNQNDDITLF